MSVCVCVVFLLMHSGLYVKMRTSFSIGRGEDVVDSTYDYLSQGS